MLPACSQRELIGSGTAVPSKLAFRYCHRSIVAGVPPACSQPRYQRVHTGLQVFLRSPRTLAIGIIPEVLTCLQGEHTMPRAAPAGTVSIDLSGEGARDQLVDGR